MVPGAKTVYLNAVQSYKDSKMPEFFRKLFLDILPIIYYKDKWR
jgi:hypothetical protein